MVVVAYNVSFVSQEAVSDGGRVGRSFVAANSKSTICFLLRLITCIASQLIPNTTF